MFWTKRVVIGDGERGLVYRNRQFEGVVAPGVHKWFDPFGAVEVKVHNIALRTEYLGSDENALIDALGSRLADTFVLADIGVGEVGLVMKNGRLVGTARTAEVTKDEVLQMIILGTCPKAAIPGPGAVAG